MSQRARRHASLETSPRSPTAIADCSRRHVDRGARALSRSAVTQAGLPAVKRTLCAVCTRQRRCASSVVSRESWPDRRRNVQSS